MPHLLGLSLNQSSFYMIILKEHKKGIHPKTGKKCNIWALSCALTFTELDGEKYFYYGYTYKTALDHFKKYIVGDISKTTEYLAK